MAEIVAAYGHASRSPADLLIMEQEKWDVYIGGLTKFAMAAHIAGLIYGQDKYSAYYDCGVKDGVYSTAIYVYPLVAGLNYRIATTHGELGKRIIELAEMQERVQVKLESYIDIKYPIAELVSAEWVGDCHDAGLAVVPAPVLLISADGRRVILEGRKVYGTVKLKYRSERHIYKLTVARREEAVENKYSSVVYAVYDGGPPKHLVVEPPPGAEELDGNCGQGGGGVIITPPDDEPDWPEPHADRHTVLNWCDPHELISDTITGV